MKTTSPGLMCNYLQMVIGFIWLLLNSPAIYSWTAWYCRVQSNTVVYLYSNSAVCNTLTLSCDNYCATENCQCYGNTNRINGVNIKHSHLVSYVLDYVFISCKLFYTECHIKQGTMLLQSGFSRPFFTMELS